jgi:3-oxoacyl-[acyl-carrier protein] reductase
MSSLIRNFFSLQLIKNQSFRALSLDTSTRTKRVFPLNPVVVVTGGSRGIGRAIALELATHGCKVVVNYVVNESAARAVCDEIASIEEKTRNGSIGVAMKADLSDFNEVQSMFKKVVENFGPVNVLVNNAGITRDSLTATMQAADFIDVISLNLNGVFWASQAAYTSSMSGQRVGRIINLASIVGQIGNQGQANYSAAKGGVIGLTRTLAKEFGARGICVNAVCPGFIDSEMTKSLNQRDILPHIPLRRFGKPEEVAGLVRFLALDPSGAYITGHCFNIDGGMAIGAT